MENKESNLRQCKQCLTTKKRTLAGKYPDNKNVKWVDEHGRQWNGKLCPECNAQRAKLTMRKIRGGSNE